jgi:hypothetical protein
MLFICLIFLNLDSAAKGTLKDAMAPSFHALIINL